MTERFTLQAFETLFEQLRYDDAAKFIETINKKTFIFDNCAVHADNEIEAKNKLINILDENTKSDFIYTFAVNTIQCKIFSSFVCKICGAEIKASEDKVAHYKTHDNQQVVNVLIEIDWFSDVIIRSIY